MCSRARCDGSSPSPARSRASCAVYRQPGPGGVSVLRLEWLRTARCATRAEHGQAAGSRGHLRGQLGLQCSDLGPAQLLLQPLGLCPLELLRATATTGIIGTQAAWSGIAVCSMIVPAAQK